MHYSDVIIGSIASQITSLMIVCSTVHSGADQRKHQSSASLAFVRGIHRWPVVSPHKGPVTRKMLPFDDVIMGCHDIFSWLSFQAFGLTTQSLEHQHDDVIKWKCFPRYWPFVRGIQRSPGNSLHKGQWHGALMFSLICVWINAWENNRDKLVIWDAIAAIMMSL